MENKLNIEKCYVDHLAIRQLIDLYNDIVNSRDWGNILEIFTINSIWEAAKPINMKWEGLESIKTSLPRSVERMEILIQISSGIIINVKNNHEANVRSLMSEFGRPIENGQGFHAVGMYHDNVIKENGEWKFLTRSLELKYFDTLPVPGSISSFKY
jgi:hypothetical protein